MKNHISVLGSGAWGTELAQLISKNNSVLMWVKEKSVKDDINQKHQNKKAYQIRGNKNSIILLLFTEISVHHFFAVKLTDWFHRHPAGFFSFNLL